MPAATTFVRCVRCKRRYGWIGPHACQPDCPGCGQAPDRELGAMIDAELARIACEGRVERRQREAMRR